MFKISPEFGKIMPFTLGERLEPNRHHKAKLGGSGLSKLHN
jgi:hypothetical protein